MSEGINALALAAAKATKKIAKMNSGAIYCRKKDIGVGANRVS
jgi:hypothetical protein